MSKAFIGQFFTDHGKMLKVYEHLSPIQQKHLSMVQVGSNFFIISNSQIKAMNRKHELYTHK